MLRIPPVRHALVALLLTIGLGPDAAARCRPDAAALARWQSPGPLPVARTTRTIVDASRPTPPNGSYPGASDRTLVTEVFFPGSAGGALLEAGPFPLVVFSHGFTGTRAGQGYLMQHLASHGYVVAVPDFPLSNGGAPGGPTIDDIENQPGDVRAVIDHLLAAGVGGGAVDPERIGAAGLSWGGLTTLLVAYHRELRDPRIRAALPMAAPACFATPAFFRGARVPLLLLYGDGDLIVPFAENGLRAFRAARRRRQLVVLEQGTHTGFSSFTATFPGEPHYDLLACPVLSDLLDGAWDDATDEPFADLVARGAGVSADAGRCPVPCAPGPVASAPPRVMPGGRQQELVKLVAAAFFDAWLRDDAAARCVLRRGLGHAGADVTVRRRGR